MIPFLNLRELNKPYEAVLKEQFNAFLETGYYILGQGVETFEADYARYCRCNYCVGTGNGLDALTLILQGYIALGRLHQGEKVILAANTYIATVLAVKRAGLIPILVEPDPETFTLDPQRIKAVITPTTTAILATHLYGRLADMKALSVIATTHNMLLLADAAQSHGADDGNTSAINFADASAYSFYPTKNLGALGDGGAVTTDDKHLAQKIRQLRNYGFSEKYVSELVGMNSRLDELQAVFLVEKLKYLDRDNATRRRLAKRYLDKITNSKIKLPAWEGRLAHVFHLFVVRVDDRETFCQYLSAHGIGYNIHYPIPPHRQKALSEFADLQLPITEKIHRQVVSIPLHPLLSEVDQNTIIDVLNRY